MKNALCLILLFVSFNVGATTYYIDPSGNDSNSGTINSPWKTLAHACSRVNNPGDIIHVNEGTFYEYDQSVLAVGVSIEGVGPSSVILSQVTASSTITLTSSYQGTLGNQHISGIMMDGDNLSARAAIIINARSNVQVYNCVFQDFSVLGVAFNGGVGWLSSEPSIFATRNSFHDNIMNNCAGYFIDDDNGWGNLNIGAQEGMLVYNNTIIQNQRASGDNGYCIKFYSYGYNKGLKIYNNTLKADKIPAYPYWSFAIESWNSLGGLEIYDNIIEGCIDLVKANLGDYERAVDIHDNIIGFDEVNPPLDGEGELGIHVEDRTTDLYIHHNHFKNLAVPIFFSTSSDRTLSNVYIYYNIFTDVGTSINSKGLGVRINCDDYSNIFDNWNICNNVICSNGRAGATMYGIQVPAGITSNITINNNIIKGFSFSPIQKNNNGSYNNISIENNIFYGNGNNNEPSGGAEYNDFAYQNNIKSDPLFVSSTDFRLQSGSPAIGKGIYHSWMTADYVGIPVKDPPSIGVFEYYIPGVPVYQSSAIANATPALLEVTYDVALANKVPSASSFRVLVNYVQRNVSSVAIVGNKVNLTLASRVNYGDIITVSYTAPVDNPLQTALGGVAASLSAKTVTNNCVTNIPVYSASVIENATPTILDLSYNLSLANIIPALTAYDVKVNSVSRTISSVSISATKVRLTLSAAVKYGDIITLSYTPPASNPIQSTTGGLAASLVNRSVTNNCAPIIPVYSSASVENATPSIIAMTYNTGMANILPAVTAFNVLINSVARSVSSVSIAGTRVLLTLSSPVVAGNVITVSYTKPATNPLQSLSGGQAISLVNKPVINNCQVVSPGNSPPIVVVNFPKTTYAGFVSEIDASASYDPNKDPLITDWIVPDIVPVSTVKSLKTRFLAPVTNSVSTVDFQLKVSDGISLQTKIVTVNILPYKPELSTAKITHIEASSFQQPDSPSNMVDGNKATNWSSIGDNQWATIKLAEPFKIKHIQLAFLKGQQYESYFDIYGSNDNIEWEPILTKAISCNFTGDLQVFDFPDSKSNTEYSYVKYVGHGNSLNTWNKVSEFRIFGTGQSVAEISDKFTVTIFPNPAVDRINISIGESTLNPDMIKIFDNSGAVLLEQKLNPENKYFQIPINLQSGVYLVSLQTGNIIIFVQRLIVIS